MDFVSGNPPLVDTADGFSRVEPIYARRHYHQPHIVVVVSFIVELFFEQFFFVSRRFVAYLND